MTQTGEIGKSKSEIRNTNHENQDQQMKNTQIDLTDFADYLQSKDLAQSSITHYKSYTELFLKRMEKEPFQIQKSDIIKHLEYLKKRKNQQNITRKNNLIALNHYFTFLYKTQQIAENPCQFLKIRGTKKKTLYRIFTIEELTQLYDNFHHHFVRNFSDGHIPKNQRKNSFLSKERNAVILSFMLHQGTTTKELDTLFLQDLDLIKATVKIRGGKKSNGRILPLKAEQIGLLMHYKTEIRPQFFDQCSETEKLFFPLAEFSRKTTKTIT